MNVLSLDLDFFLNEVPLDPEGERLDESQFIPWNDEEVLRFLEDRCGLSKERPIRGCIARTHDAAIQYFGEMIRERHLRTPFKLVHVDSHADQGSFFPNNMNLIEETCELRVLHLNARAEEPLNLKRNTEYLSEVNYLPYAIACNWISALTWVPNPGWIGFKKGAEGNDVDRNFRLFKNYDVDSGALQFKTFEPKRLKNLWMEGPQPEPDIVGPEIPFTIARHDEFRAMEGFDLVFLAESPKYTPPTSDCLIELIREYIDES